MFYEFSLGFILGVGGGQVGRWVGLVVQGRAGQGLEGKN